MESNTLASVGGTDVSDERIGSVYSSPDSKSYGKINPAFELSYTFADSRTQIFGGTEMEDFLTQDGAFGIGIRQGFGTIGNLRASLLASAAREVYKDPYVVNVDRSKTDVTSGGMRLGWENIMQTDFDLTLTKRNIDIDKELSGTTATANGGLATPLNASQINDLDRNGDKTAVELSYRLAIDADNLIIPSVTAVDYNLDGEAVSMSGGQMGLSYMYTGLQSWEFIANGLVGSMSSDEYNPIYGKKQDLDSYGASLAATYKEPFGLKDWKARGAFVYGKQNSNIDFYDTSLNSLTLGMMYSF